LLRLRLRLRLRLGLRLNLRLRLRLRLMLRSRVWDLGSGGSLFTNTWHLALSQAQLHIKIY